jgi:hypothetical protein
MKFRFQTLQHDGKIVQQPSMNMTLSFVLQFALKNGTKNFIDVVNRYRYDPI